MIFLPLNRSLPLILISAAIKTTSASEISEVFNSSWVPANPWVSIWTVCPFCSAALIIFSFAIYVWAIPAVHAAIPQYSF